MLCPFYCFEIHALLYHLPERRHVSEPLCLLHTLLNCVINLFFCREAADTESNGGVRQVLVSSYSPQYVAGFQRGGGTRATG